MDGWLLYDFRGNNPVAREITGVKGHLTRRFFYWMPEGGRPVKLVHRIEAPQFAGLEGEERLYGSHQELREQLGAMLRGVSVVAMETGEIPYISYVDGGTVDLVRSLGIKVVSSEGLIEERRAPLTAEQIRSHCCAADHLNNCVQRAWLFIRDHVENGAPITEKDVQEFLLCEFAACGMITDHPPICAAGVNSADPHHEPTDRAIERGELVLIDLWGKLQDEGAIFADITKVGVVGTPTARHNEIFQIVARAREAAIAAVRVGAQGWEIDQASRDVIEAAGYGACFTHRTGHNISTECHGPGTHMDNFETHDTRPLLPGTCFSIEPGIYLPGEFGVRLECDVLLGDKVEVTGGPQEEIWSF